MSTLSSLGRIPKKPKTEDGGSGAGGSGGPGGSRPPPIRISQPGSSTGASNGKSFQPMGQCPVQTNNFRVTINKQFTKFTRISMETFLCGGKTEIKLSAGVVAVSGGINTTERRLALKQIFRKVFQRHPDVFGFDFLKYTYDSATTIYAVDGAFKGGDQKLEVVLKREDFSDDEWRIIARILRRQNSFFKVLLSANGVVWAGGPNAMNPENKQELCRVVETASSEGLNTTDFLHYNSQTFNVREEPVTKPEQTSEIRSGFDKAVRLAEGTGGNTEIIMAIDTKLSPFYAATSALKFVCCKYAEAKGFTSAGGPSRSGQYGARPGQFGGDRGGRGGRDGRVPSGHRGGYQGQQDQRRRSRSRSPHRDAHEPDYNMMEVREVMEAFQRGNEKKLFERIEEAMKGLLVDPIHLSKDKNRNELVVKFSPSTAETTSFKIKVGTEPERDITVAQYFLEHHGKRLQFPHLPLVVSGRLHHEVFTPLEMLRIVPGQRIKNSKMSATVQSAMTGQKAFLPRQQVDRIQKILKTHLKIDANPHLKAFGIQVSREPIQMQATLLAPCQMVFGKGSKTVPAKGVSFDQQGPFFRPANIGVVAVVAFDGVRVDLGKFCENFYAECKRNGLQMATGVDGWMKFQWLSHNTAQIKEEMERLLEKKITILVGITPEKKPEVHDVLKYYEAGVGLQTMQLHDKTANSFANNIQPQTMKNVMRKFNIKCGGLNFAVEAMQRFQNTPICSNDFINKKLFHGVQFFGFEMTHGASRTLFDKARGTFDGEPTIVGCAYSLKAPTELGGVNWFQERNEYKLKDLENRFSKCLKIYHKAVGAFPETVVVFRTGAGDGDFPRVEEEIEEMRNAMKKISGAKVPKLLVVVVQKTSHNRLYPKNIQGTSAKEQNVNSGTVVDSMITSPGRQEFVMVSQVALIGTARPIKYSIVANDPGWSKNEVMNLSYFLAFAHQVSYSPPAQPHVLYAADNLAKRGRNNFIMHKKLGHLNQAVRDVLQSHQGVPEEHRQEQMDAALVEDITKSMNAMAVRNKNFWA